ncbi:MAG: ABC transporter permease [Gammaproteobacteria bacterium]|nr:ABC transporter permease [Gammaproteobacteria bacterium]NIR82022.1 ABC transporter permease [Gammaproteobacteria bacterium]NIR89250.1 ABC transporter permease [Gammaproteobacteria bacterium]NIU03132.1 ABC transporter permease [Gammaproteobacteria bacterium]NIV50648.1 ABC transporter permease subunit [Gammaproteobacteria bacterium]
MVLRLSFGLKGAEWDVWTLQNYADLVQSLYLRSILLTFKLAFLSTIIVVALSIPIALVMARTPSPGLRRFILFVLLLPLLVNLLLQSYGWLVLLAPDGLLNRGLQAIGLTDRPILLLFNQTGVLIGLVQTTFPLAALPIAGTLRNIPYSLEEAATTLGAGRIRIFAEILLPLMLPGILAASILVFAYNASSFVIPFLLGGRRVSMLAVLIRDQMGPLLNWPFGAANATVLVVLTLIALAVYQHFASARGSVQSRP